MNRIVEYFGRHRGVLGLSTLVLAVLAYGILVVGVASAQAPTPTPRSQGSELNQSFWQSLAGRLSITIDQLRQAVKDAAKDTVSGALEENRVTQDQANKLNRRIDQWQPGQSGPNGLPFGGPLEKGFGEKGLRRGGGLWGGQVALDAAAQALGMSTTDLTTELRSGKSLADIATEKNVEANTVKQAMINAAKAQIDQEQQAGRLTQEQADQLKQRIDQDAQNMDLVRPFSGRGGHDRGRGMPFSGPRSTPAPQSSTTSSGDSA